MISINNFPSNYHDISWRQLYHLKSISNQAVTGPLDNVITENKVNNWKIVAQNLDQSIKATSSFYRCLLDIVTLHLLKKWVLRSVLPGVLRQIAFKVNEIALEKLSQSTGISKELLPCFTTLTKAEKYFNEHKVTLCENDKTKTLGVEAKTIQEVENYFKEKKDLIVHHKAIPALPRWYHATGSDDIVTKILCESKLIQHAAPAGYGVYFSTQHESVYGGYCFALDQEMIHPLRSVSYFTPLGSPDIWIRVQHDVAINWNSVAHIVTSSDNQAAIPAEILSY